MMKPITIKVIVITIVVLLLSAAAVMYHFYYMAPFNYDNSYQQYIAANSSEPKNGWIGAQLTDLTQNIKQHLKYPDPYGVYVQDTIRNSPSQTAGILPGDIISKINNADAQDVLPAIKLISDLNPGKVYPFIIFRDGKFTEYQITISAKQ
jgi:S1-C subfamily serine protease